jgi:hypothetical protein
MKPKKPSFLDSVNHMFDRAVATLDLPKGLYAVAIEKIAVAYVESGLG